MVAKGLRKGYVWEVSWRLNRDCNILTPSSSVFSSTSFSFCWAAQPGALWAQPSAESWFSLPRTATTDSKLIGPVCGPGLYNCWHPPASCGRHICTQFNPSTVKVIPWYLRPDAPVSLIDGLVRGQYVALHLVPEGGIVLLDQEGGGWKIIRLATGVCRLSPKQENQILATRKLLQQQHPKPRTA